MYLLNNRFSSPIYIVYFTNQPFSGLIYMLNTKDLVFQQRKCLQYPKININQNSESEPAGHCMHYCSLMKRYFTLSVLTMIWSTTLLHAHKIEIKQTTQYPLLITAHTVSVIYKLRIQYPYF